MPELPEVETVVKGLRPLIKDRRVTAVEIREKNMIAYPENNIDEFKESLIGSKIEAINRRGKYIIIELNNEKNMVIHLRMTGKLLVKEVEEFRDKHTHVIFSLNDGQEIRFNNIRKFGRVYLIDKNHPEQAGGLSDLGPEPLSEDLTLTDFKKLFKNRRALMKSLLLNQHFVAGIGNIYADEILFLSGVRPDRTADTLTEDEKEKIYHNMRHILKKGIIYGGTSFSDYVNAFGEKGSFQEELKVHQREGEECYSCGTKINKIKVSGRSTYFCPKCQK
ncbi:MAG: formamidopyrimidine-DNA glycosylase [Halanaerobium sp. 4-GBenrich]|jgi:formamidopyrimidine-DNA glycosylase|uniref:Formamidopyrimidine-DNA glycosylase n=1 Tax=Halanaerobium congolense TaxID=54121 RepID=A0A1G6QDT8_9FIRM|nr:bifunctional DNA-formamidopyrimidine glycosylase/DNA-(apurinic or apyrimidinic site) lyase [Halanaerobium congolense]KXS49479.1 MAG: formamidopyrimidine-DNA glycosylase [Halanaerobium sp. T82-1]ODS50132.1 MAG: formamidopyrimidine-DNA glycosylase [Halanaerobium sp. 4-GBenrich]OEG62217.1 MAG: DNA-formamidopyrimidine glycosylase [Halanaerobium sp. MDAL1]PUU92125.1 MAG: formamidopyrimidine-DNA glycosylase [Halanaerobium sp.]PTX17911.1 DNA-(apurinic or apyrimidinic site) lyase [Halanaerobium con